jgi:hypothetical protein
MGGGIPPPETSEDGLAQGQCATNLEDLVLQEIEPLRKVRRRRR